MLGTSTTYRLFISDALLDLSIAAIGRLSLETRRYESIQTTVRRACELVVRTGHCGAGVRDFLAAGGFDGPHRIHLTVDRRWKAGFKLACGVMDQATALDLRPIQRFAVLVRLIRLSENNGY